MTAAAVRDLCLVDGQDDVAVPVKVVRTKQVQDIGPNIICEARNPGPERGICAIDSELSGAAHCLWGESVGAPAASSDERSNRTKGKSSHREGENQKGKSARLFAAASYDHGNAPFIDVDALKMLHRLIFAFHGVPEALEHIVQTVHENGVDVHAPETAADIAATNLSFTTGACSRYRQRSSSYQTGSARSRCGKHPE